MENFDYPEMTIWITSTGRMELLPETIESFIKHNTYPNYRFIIIEQTMTDVSREFFALEYVDNDATAKYLSTLQERFPDVKMEIIIQPYKPLGQMYNQLLSMSGDYFINLEDDFTTVCDPHDQIVDSIRLLRADPKLLGLRMDLRDETIFEYCPRFPRTGCKEKMKYTIIDTTCSGGAQVMDTAKVKAIGGYCIDHSPKDYGQPEFQQQAAMRDNKMYTAVNLKYWGFLKHMGRFGIRGGDRSWTNIAYDELEKYGWYGDGSKRVPKPHKREWYISQRVDNGKP